MVPRVPDPCDVSAGCLWLLALPSPTEIILSFHSCIKSLNWGLPWVYQFWNTSVWQLHIITWDVIADLLLASPNFLSPSNPAAVCLDPTTALRFAIRPPSHRSPPPQWDRDLGWSGHGPKETHGQWWTKQMAGHVLDERFEKYSHLERSDPDQIPSAANYLVIFTCIPDKFKEDLGPWKPEVKAASTRISEMGCEKLKRSINPQSSKLQTKCLTILLCITIRYVESNKKMPSNSPNLEVCNPVQPAVRLFSTTLNPPEPSKVQKVHQFHQNHSTKIQHPSKIPWKFALKIPLDPPGPAAAQLPRWALAASSPGAPGAPGPSARHRGRARSSGRWRPVAGSWAPWAPWEKGKNMASMCHPSDA